MDDGDDVKTREGIRLVRSNADNLREVIEVLGSCVQGKVVLQHERGQPHIVRRNRRALFAKLAEDRRVVVSSLVVGEDHAHAVLQQKPPEYALVLRLPAAVRETRPKLTDHDERQHDGFGLLQQRQSFRDAFTQIDVSIGVESNPHRQRSSSTRS